METNNNILDNYLHKKVEQASFTMPEAHWQHALQALEKQDEDKRRIFGWWRVLLIIGLLAGSTALYSWLKTSTPASNTNTVSIQKNTDKVIAALPTKTNSMATAMPIEDESNVTENTNVTTNAATNTINSTQNSNNYNNANTTQNTNQLATTVKPVSIQKNTTSPTAETQTTSKKITEKNVVQKNTNVEANNVEAPTASKEKVITAIAKKVNFPIVQEESRVVKNTKKEVVVTEAIISSSKKTFLPTEQIVNSSIEAQEIISPIEMQAMMPIASNLPTNPVKEVKVLGKTISIPSTIANLLPTVATAIVAITEKEKQVEKKTDKKVDTKKQIENTNNAAVVKKEPEPIVVAKPNDSLIQGQIMPLYFSPKNSVIISANGSVVKNISGAKQGTGITPWVGAGYQWYLSKKWSLSAQLGFTYLSQLPFAYKATVYQYSFGVDSSVFNLQQQQLYQLGLPVTANYQIGLRHALQFGIGANINAGVKNKVTPYNTTKKISNYTYQNGFTSLQPFITIGYQLKLTNHLFFSTLYNQGLTDITKNAFHQNTAVDKASRLQIGFTYKLQ